MKYFTTHESEKSAKAMVLMLKTNTTKNVVDYDIRPNSKGEFDLFIKVGSEIKVLTDAEKERIKEIGFRWLDAQLELDTMNIKIVDWEVIRSTNDYSGTRRIEVANEDGDKEWISI